MGILSKLFSGGAEKLVTSVGGAVERFAAGHLGKKELTLEVEKLVAARDSEIEKTLQAELGAKERIMVAELTQGDKFTKRARPMILYSGPVIVIAVSAMHYIAFYMGMEPPPMPEILTWFMGTWGAIGSTYVVSRTMDKRGNGNKLTKMLTGGTPSLDL